MEKEDFKDRKGRDCIADLNFSHITTGYLSSIYRWSIELLAFLNSCA